MIQEWCWLELCWLELWNHHFQKINLILQFSLHLKLEILFWILKLKLEMESNTFEGRIKTVIEFYSDFHLQYILYWHKCLKEDFWQEQTLGKKSFIFVYERCNHHTIRSTNLYESIYKFHEHFKVFEFLIFFAILYVYLDTPIQRDRQNYIIWYSV